MVIQEHHRDYEKLRPTEAIRAEAAGIVHRWEIDWQGPVAAGIIREPSPREGQG